MHYRKLIPQYNWARHDKTNKMSVCPAKTQISLGIHPVWSESSLCAQWVAKDASFLHADSEDSDQTGWMPSLIWVFDGRIAILLVLSCRCSYADCSWGGGLEILFYHKMVAIHIPDSGKVGPFRYFLCWNTTPCIGSSPDAKCKSQSRQSYFLYTKIAFLQC